MLCWLGILAEEARAEGRQRRVELWRTTFHSFVRVHGGKDIGVRQMEGLLKQRYENYLLTGGLCPNTTSFYLRNLRSAYSKAVKAKLCPAPRQNPFAEVYTGVAKGKEVDFIAQQRDRVIYVQVAYSLHDGQTAEREYASLESIRDNYEKVVVSLDDMTYPSNNGIRHIRAWDFHTLL